MKFIKSNKGMTVVEILVALAILGLVSVGIIGFFTDSFKFQAKSQDLAYVQKLTDGVFERIKDYKVELKRFDGTPTNFELTNMAVGASTIIENLENGYNAEITFNKKIEGEGFDLYNVTVELTSKDNPAVVGTVSSTIKVDKDDIQNVGGTPVEQEKVILYYEQMPAETNIPNSVSVTKGENTRIAKQEPKKGRSTFIGWKEKDSEDDILYKFPNTIKMDNDKTLIAVWDETEYTVTFDQNGGALLGESSKKVIAGEKYGTLPSANKSGHEFLGWYDKVDGGNKIEEDTIVTIKKDHQLYARFVSNVEVYNGVINHYLKYSTEANSREPYLTLSREVKAGTLLEFNKEKSEYGLLVEADIIDAGPAGMVEENGDYIVTQNDFVYNLYYTINEEYTVNHYLETTKEGYDLKKEVKVATSGIINFKNNAVGSYEGFSNVEKIEIGSNVTNEETVTLAQAQAHEINIYYSRDRYTLDLNRGDNNIMSVSGIGTNSGIVTDVEGKATYKWGETVEISAIPQISVDYNLMRYEFASWIETSGTFSVPQKQTAIIEMPKKDLTINAYGKLLQVGKMVTLYFDGNGSNVTQIPEVMSGITDENGSITFDIPKDKPKRDGYEFVFWSTDKNYKGPCQHRQGETFSGDANPMYQTITITEDTTLCAVWRKIVTVTYNDGEGNAVKQSKTVTNVGDTSVSITLPSEENTFTKDGYVICQWKYYGTFTGNVGDTVTVTDGTTFEAIWGYSVTYDANGGDSSTVPQVQKVIPTNDTTITISSDEPVRNGYIFAGWSPDADGDYPLQTIYLPSSTYKNQGYIALPGATMKLPGSVKLYAIWAKEVIITFDAVGGTFSNGNKESEIRKTIVSTDVYGTLPEAPSKNGFTFKGWYTELSGNGQKVSANMAYRAMDDHSIYAYWSLNSDMVGKTVYCAPGSDIIRLENTGVKTQVFYPDQTPRWKILADGRMINTSNLLGGLLYINEAGVVMSENNLEVAKGSFNITIDQICDQMSWADAISDAKLIDKQDFIDSPEIFDIVDEVIWVTNNEDISAEYRNQEVYQYMYTPSGNIAKVYLPFFARVWIVCEIDPYANFLPVVDVEIGPQLEEDFNLVK